MNEPSPRLSQFSRLPRSPETTRKIRSYFKQASLAPGVLLILVSLPLLSIGMALGGREAEWNPFFRRQPTFWEQLPSFEELLRSCFYLSFGAIPLMAGLGMLIVLQRRWNMAASHEDLFDTTLRGDLEMLKSRALMKIEMILPGSKVGVAPSGEAAVSDPTIWCTGCSERNENWSRFDDAALSWRAGRDGMTRYRIYRLTFLFLAEHHLAYYTCDFNVESGLILIEETLDCHYKDVTMLNYLERKIHAVELPTWLDPSNSEGANPQSVGFFMSLTRHFASKLANSYNFSLRVFEICLGSTSLRIPIRMIQNSETFEEDSAVDPVVSRVRYLLREKRMSYVRMLGSRGASLA